MGLWAFLPIFGIGVVVVPAALSLMLTGRLAAGIFFIIFYFTLSGSIEYFLKPRMVGRRAKMHTLLVFLSIMLLTTVELLRRRSERLRGITPS